LRDEYLTPLTAESNLRFFDLVLSIGLPDLR
jgi:hypothetical protein